MTQDTHDHKLQPAYPRPPKRTGGAHPAHLNWFPYYAGYDSAFVDDVLTALNIDTRTTVLDPWNGSGTTTTTAYRLGATVVGCDINPAMVIAAKSALLDPATAPSLIPLANEIAEVASAITTNCSNDLLSVWYVPLSANAFRRLHRAIWKLLVDTDRPPSIAPTDISHLSTLAAFFLTALMRTARHFLVRFIGSNPTWIRRPATLAHRIRPQPTTVTGQFLTEVHRMTATLENASANGLKYPQHGNRPKLAVGSSTSLPYDSSSIDAVVSSPPYLTRIDYAVATKPELAVLGMSDNYAFDTLRRLMIGAPTVRPVLPTLGSFGRSCDSFLHAVHRHPSKGSHNYYYKLFTQYFGDMKVSLNEIARVLRDDGRCVLVVQDSYYKELHADLAQYICDLALHAGLSLCDRHDFTCNRNMVRVNSSAYKYRDSAVAVESVLWFSKC